MPHASLVACAFWKLFCWGVTDCSRSVQYLDGGSHTLNIASHWRFTAVAVIKFTGDSVDSERIFDFGNGSGNDQIEM